MLISSGLDVKLSIQIDERFEDPLKTTYLTWLLVSNKIDFFNAIEFQNDAHIRTERNGKLTDIVIDHKHRRNK